MLYPNAVNNESAKPNKNNRGKINLKNLLAWSLERAVNTVGDTIITKNNIEPSNIEFKYERASNNIIFR